MPIGLRKFDALEHAIGTDQDIPIGLYEADGDGLGVSGISASYSVYKGVSRRKYKPFKGTAVLTKTSAAGEIALTNGLATVSILDTDFSAEPGGEYWHTLQLTDADGVITHMGGGRLLLRSGLG